MSRDIVLYGSNGQLSRQQQVEQELAQVVTRIDLITAFSRGIQEDIASIRREAIERGSLTTVRSYRYINAAAQTGIPQSSIDRLNRMVDHYLDETDAQAGATVARIRQIASELPGRM